MFSDFHKVCSLFEMKEGGMDSEDVQRTAASLFLGLDEVWMATIASTPIPFRVQIGDLL